jgi:hypothetical protein
VAAIIEPSNSAEANGILITDVHAIRHYRSWETTLFVIGEFRTHPESDPRFELGAKQALGKIR